MGGKAGSQVEITITGENIDDADALTFSDRRITASRKLNSAGQPEPNKYRRLHCRRLPGRHLRGARDDAAGNLLVPSVLCRRA